MNWILKNKNSPSEIAQIEDFTKRKNISRGKKAKAFLVVLFLVSVFSNFSVNVVSAAESPYSTIACTKLADPVCTEPAFPACVVSLGLCATRAEALLVAGQNPLPTMKKAIAGVATEPFTLAIQFILTQVQALVIMLFGIAATLFAWVIDPKNISGDGGLLNKQAVKDVWIMVRDLLNMTFILILLFSAFCTIFQVEKWNLKKVWLNILINALLVNFSYPIARFFIDISNVAFYYFVNHLFSATGNTAVSGSSILAGFGSASSIGSILTPKDFTTNAIAYQIAIIVVLFIMGMTLMVIAALFIVRLVALTMLVMFSPIGFVGYIFPATASFADDWWKKLFAYSFFAPVMIFIMAISLKILEALQSENFTSVKSYASNNTPNSADANWIASVAFFTIPVIILWMGMGIAQKMGIAGADKIVGAVKSGGKWLANAPGKYSGIYGATKKATEDFNKKGKLFGKKIPLMGNEGREAREAAMAGFATGGIDGFKDARRNVHDKKIADQMKEYKDRNYTSDQIADDLDSSDKNTQMAAVRALMADKGALGANPDRMVKALGIAGNDMALRNKVIDSADDFAGNDLFKAQHLNAVLNAATNGLSSTNPAQLAAKKAIEGKIKGKVMKENAKKLIDYEINHLGKNVTAAYSDNLGKLNAKDLGEQKGLHENIGADANLRSFMTAQKTSDSLFHQEMFKNMKKGNRVEYVTHKVSP